MFTPIKLFHSNLIIESKAKNFTMRIETERCSTLVGSGLTFTLSTGLERVAKDKHSSLLQKFVNYGRKKLGYGANVIQLFFLRP